MPTMSEGGKKGGGNNKKWTEVEPGHQMTFKLLFVNGQKSFRTLEELKFWLTLNIIADTMRGSDTKNLSWYEIQRIETFILERREVGGLPTEVYRPQKVDGALPEG